MGHCGVGFWREKSMEIKQRMQGRRGHASDGRFTTGID